MKNFKNVLLLVLIVFVVSCNKNEKLGALKDKTNNDQKILIFEFPDTVTVNTLINGRLKYNKLDEQLKKTDFNERYIFLHIKTSQNKEDVLLQEMSTIDDRFIFEDTIGDGWFNFKAVFTQPGNSILHGVIEDVILDDEIKTGEAGITIETIISKQVHVQKE